MTKALFGVAAGFALVVAPAWAGDEKLDEQDARRAIATTDGTSESGSDMRPLSKLAAARVVDSGRDSAAIEESAEVRASRDPEYDEDRWMRDR